MSNVEIELHDDGIQELLKSSDIMAELKTHGRRVLASAGDGYAMNEHTGTTRANVMVYTATASAYKDNLANNTLLKAVST